MNYEEKVELMSFHIKRLKRWTEKAPPREYAIKFHCKCLSHIAENRYPNYCILCRDFLNSEDLDNIAGFQKIFEIHPELTPKLCKIIGIELRI